MRSAWISLAAACWFSLSPVMAFGQAGSDTVRKLLSYRPTQKGVDYEVPTDPAAIAACKAESTANPPGYLLRDGQGKLLCRFVDTDGNGKLDTWSYFQDGFEIYREVDKNEDILPDECRWMNAGGSRIALVRNNKIVGWKRLSAEEASKVLVQALVARDLDLLETVMAKPEELTTLGVPKGEVERATRSAEARVATVKTLLSSLVGWDEKTSWLRLDGSMPHAIPADAMTGLKDDLLLYENAVIFAGNPTGPSSTEKVAFLQAPEMIKVGDAWKFVDLPRAMNPGGQNPIVAMEGGIRAAIYRNAGIGGESGPQDPAIAAALKGVADYDQANGEKLNSTEKGVVAQFHVGRIAPLREVVKAAEKNPEVKLTHNRFIVDSLAAAYQTGVYPKGRDFLDAMEKDGGPLGSYAAFRRISADYNLANDQPGANPVAVQKKWMNDLKDFLTKYGKSDEAADALLQIASANEFNAEEDEAKKYYTQLAESFPETDSGRKAAGALRRLDLVGKPMSLKGTGIDGQPIDTAQYRGKNLLVAFWATWAGPVKRDLPELTKVYEKYRAKGFEIVGVCLDNEKADLDTFLKANSLPWAQIYEKGGMESRLANEFGIISLPTMILIDGQGKVINRNIRTASDLEIQLEKLANARTAASGSGNAR